MNTYDRNRVLIAVAFLGLMATGCATASRKPIATSMADLAGESRTFRSIAVDYTELFAVNGAIMMPGTRMLTYYPRGGRTPAYMIGLTGTLAQATSRLTMRSTADRTAKEVLNNSYRFSNITPAGAKAPRRDTVRRPSGIDARLS